MVVSNTFNEYQIVVCITFDEYLHLSDGDQYYFLWVPAFIRQGPVLLLMSTSIYQIVVCITFYEYQHLLDVGEY